MSAREELARIIRDGVGVWRTPLEAADAILPLIREARAAELETAADEVVRLKEIGRKPYAACSPDELASYYSYVRRDNKEHWLRDRAAAIRAGD